MINANLPAQMRRTTARNAAIAVFLFLCLAGTTAGAASVPWRSLSPEQQEALAPLAQQWDTLPEVQQHRWLKTTKRYSHLPPEQKQRFRERLTAWSKLTPEQRTAAREKYRAFKKVPEERREQVKEMVRQDQANKAQQGASSVPAMPPDDKP